MTREEALRALDINFDEGLLASVLQKFGCGLGDIDREKQVEP